MNEGSLLEWYVEFPSKTIIVLKNPLSRGLTRKDSKIPDVLPVERSRPFATFYRSSWMDLIPHKQELPFFKREQAGLVGSVALVLMNNTNFVLDQDFMLSVDKGDWVRGNNWNYSDVVPSSKIEFWFSPDIRCF